MCCSIRRHLAPFDNMLLAFPASCWTRKEMP
jgi:hypothetical protein